MSAERLQKILAHAGVASRRKAEELIEAGHVSVNGKVVRELGSKADLDQDLIQVDGRTIRETQDKVYYVLYKPAGCVTTLSDPENRPTIKAYLEAHRPWGATVEVSLEQLGPPCQIDAVGPAYDAARDAFRTAWDGVEPVDMGVGGSIPFIATFQTLFPSAAVLVTGVEDPDARAHGPNESLHLGEFARACLAEVLLFANVAETVRPAAG